MSDDTGAFKDESGEKLDQRGAELDFVIGVLGCEDAPDANDVVSVLIHASIEFFDAGVHLFFDGSSRDCPRHGLPCLGCCFKWDRFTWGQVEDKTGDKVESFDSFKHGFDVGYTAQRRNL